MELEKIEQIAREAHDGQKRWNGDDYVTHPIRVAANMPNDKTKAIALLHDVMEDTDISMSELVGKGVDLNIMQTLCFLTRCEDQTYPEYINQIAKSADINTDAIIVKIGDLKDNLSDIEDGSQKIKYKLALSILELKLQEKKNE